MPKTTEQNLKKEHGSSPPDVHNTQPLDSPLKPRQIEQLKVSDALTSSVKITELETVLGTLPDTRAHNNALAAEAEMTEQRESALSEIALNEKRVAGSLGEIDGTLSRIDRVIGNDAYSSQSMLQIGRVLEERSNFDAIKRQTGLLFEQLSSLGKGDDAVVKLATLGESQGMIEELANKMDDFYQFLSRLQRQTSNYYDGKNNEDEDMLRRLQQQLDGTFDSLKELRRLCQNEEDILIDYQKKFSL